MPLKALVIVILILTVLLLIPLGIDGGYSGEKLILGLRVGFLNIRVFPGKLKPIKLKRPKKTIKEKEPKTGEIEKEKVPLNRKELFRLAKIGLKALGRFKRKLHVDYLRIRYTFATDDPFSTAMGFGYSSAALGVIVPLIDSAFDIGERDIGTSFDFMSDKSSIDCWLTTTIKVWEVFYIAIAFGIDYLKLKHEKKPADHI